MELPQSSPETKFRFDSKTNKGILKQIETIEKWIFLFEFKEGKNFNHRNTSRILRIKI
jgi:hypothetical protein